MHRVIARSASTSAESTTTQPCCSSASPHVHQDSSPLKGRFVLPAAEWQQLLASHPGKSPEEVLFSLITPASKLARPPISGYHVGAVALAGSGNVYVGVNIEFPGTALNNSIHGEQYLLVNCLHAGESSIRALAVSAAPCGHCRQFYSEIKDADDLEFIFGKDARPKFLNDLLPERFGPADLQDEPFPLLLEQQSNSVAWSPEAEAAMAEAGRRGDSAFAQAAGEALAEAQKCYAPYTRCHSGAAIITTSGGVHSGGYIESAAYNPSMSPFHAAVVAAVTAGGLPDGYGQIREVVLAERPDAPVQHAANIRLLLQAVAPAARLTVLPTRKA
ncbi:hypothetical protein CHLRE_13g570550v5 [Chlamydomonas reinhardtii]|uniref:CMP/dCMP-type deaminase domain-containing protein n=1 Tax=Chlamydomonas reinhardtii TaxID=3055 RepID=A0A2K3CZM2_CHLRE|nr:uncharacterized protein CHLRE_13g570550v5 [Chlamydomonas reinhardtii]PNW73736.1 hypothetical protein CHLRE_13g570550v5 [Chlamydomonas reinhardtii]